MTSKSANRYSPEFREWAVRMLLDHRDEYRSEHAAIHSLIHSLTPKIGCSIIILRLAFMWNRKSTDIINALNGSYKQSGH